MVSLLFFCAHIPESNKTGAQFCTNKSELQNWEIPFSTSLIWLVFYHTIIKNANGKTTTTTIPTASTTTATPQRSSPPPPLTHIATSPSSPSSHSYLPYYELPMRLQSFVVVISCCSSSFTTAWHGHHRTWWRRIGATVTTTSSSASRSRSQQIRVVGSNPQFEFGRFLLGGIEQGPREGCSKWWITSNVDHHHESFGIFSITTTTTTGTTITPPWQWRAV